MNVLTGEGRLRPALSRQAGAPRVRPGEAPAWTAVAVKPVDGRAWRERARRHGMGVDAWLGVLVESLCIEEFLQPLGLSLPALLAAPDGANADARLAPTDALRRWVRLLDGEFAGVDVPADELPSVVLSERVVAQLPVRVLHEALTTATTSVDETIAIACDRAAALHGLTLEGWALRLALRASR